jgi:hypothetical protein
MQVAFVIVQTILRLFVAVFFSILAFNIMYPRFGELKAVSYIAAVWTFVASTWVIALFL